MQHIWYSCDGVNTPLGRANAVFGSQACEGMKGVGVKESLLPVFITGFMSWGAR